MKIYGWCAAVLLAVSVLAGCGGAHGGAAPAQEAPRTAAAVVKLDCGTASNGLGVEAESSRDKATACPVAVDVADAYLAGPEADGNGKPVAVTVRGAGWNCRQVATEINPFVECISAANPVEKVRLVS